MRAFRLLRGMVSTAIAWGLAWAVLGAAFTILTGLVRAFDVPLRTYASVALSSALFYAIVGVWAGGIFAITMAISERRHTFTELRMSRVITWGVLGGVSYPLLGWTLSKLTGQEIGGLTTALVLTATFGALSAWAMLRLARRTADPEPTLLGAGGVETWTAHADAVHSRVPRT